MKKKRRALLSGAPLDVRDEGSGWLSIGRGETSNGVPIRRAVYLYGFNARKPRESKRPHLVHEGHDYGPMSDDGRKQRR